MPDGICHLIFHPAISVCPPLPDVTPTIRISMNAVFRTQLKTQDVALRVCFPLRRPTVRGINSMLWVTFINVLSTMMAPPGRMRSMSINCTQQVLDLNKALKNLSAPFSFMKASVAMRSQSPPGCSNPSSLFCQRPRMPSQSACPWLPGCRCSDWQAPTPPQPVQKRSIYALLLDPSSSITAAAAQISCRTCKATIKAALAGM